MCTQKVDSFFETLLDTEEAVENASVHVGGAPRRAPSRCIPDTLFISGDRVRNVQQRTRVLLLEDIPNNTLEPALRLMDGSPASALWQKISSVYERAKKEGHIYMTDTRPPEVLKDEKLGVKFVLRVAAALRDKPKPTKTSAAQGIDPFLPYEDNLWVQHLSARHTLLLNKFNVVPHHTLVVTRTLESQLDALNADDLGASWEVMQAYPSGALAYFNGGPDSGASQPHKHLQIVPLPLGGVGSKGLPFEAAMTAAIREAGSKSLQAAEMRNMPFQSYCTLLPDRVSPGQLHNGYMNLRHMSGLDTEDGSYNLLLTGTYMSLIPRSQESYGPVSVNALGFAGSFLVRSEEELQILKTQGPMTVLRAVSRLWT